MRQIHPAFRTFIYATSLLGAYLALVNFASWKTHPSPENKHNIIDIHDWYSALSAETELVSMQIFDTSHYGLDPEGDDDWAHLLPLGEHLVYLKPDKLTPNSSKYPYTVTLFHELKCLELFRKAYQAVSASSSHQQDPGPLIHHCLNYLRQQVLCHANTKLESVKNFQAQSARQYITVCRDWTAVYHESENSNREL